MKEFVNKNVEALLGIALCLTFIIVLMTPILKFSYDISHSKPILISDKVYKCTMVLE